jgi:hypothetical protein
VTAYTEGMHAAPVNRRPFLLLAGVIGAAALLHAMFSPASSPADFDSDLPPGMVCTTCGPIPTGVCPLPLAPDSAPAVNPAAHPEN